MTIQTDNDPGLRKERGSGVQPKWVPVLIVILGSAWAIHFVWQTNENSYGDQPTVMFINFLIWPLVASGALVALMSLKGSADDPSVGLSDRRRLLLVVGVPLYGIAVVYGGFVAASIAFVLVMLPVLGVRNPLLLAGIAALVTAFVWFGFSYLMAVPLPLWPRGMGW